MEIVIILGLILLNGVLSMSEIALVSARKSRLETDAKKGSKAAGTALKLANSPDIFLATIRSALRWWGSSPVFTRATYWPSGSHP